jgi:hypothetical protein
MQLMLLVSYTVYPGLHFFISFMRGVFFPPKNVTSMGIRYSSHSYSAESAFLCKHEVAVLVIMGSFSHFRIQKSSGNP